MITKNQITQYKKAIRRGLPEGEIKQRMLADGFTKEDMGKVFAPASERSMQDWYILAGLLSLIFSIVFLNKQPVLFSPYLFLQAAFCVYQLIVPNTALQKKDKVTDL
jgi:hypothetical protein